MKCKYCNFYEASTKSALTNHQNNCWNNPDSINEMRTDFYCGECDERFQRKRDLDNHNIISHSKLIKNNYICEYCSKNWETTETLYNRHVNRCPQNRGSIKCSYCNKRRNNKEIIEAHEQECYYNTKLRDSNFNSEKYTVKDNSINNIGVYKIITPNGRTYLGMTTNSFKDRWRVHFNKLKNNKHHCKGLQNAYNLSEDWDNFQKIIIEEYIKPVDKTELINLSLHIEQREKELWNKYSSQEQLLNGEPTGTGAVKHTEETRRKQGEATTKRNKRYCLIYYRNCVKCNKLFTSGSPTGKYCIIHQDKKYIKTYLKRIDYSKICSNKDCCNFIIGKPKYCSDECRKENTFYNCQYCNKKLNEELVKKSQKYCNKECSSSDIYDNKRALFPKVIELHETGLTYGQITKKLPTLSRQTIYNYVKEYEESLK